MPSTMPAELVGTLRVQKYHLVGSHSAVKSCRWHREALVHDRPCYKQKFYGIETHRCIQMTPTVVYCTMRCLFCWRVQSGDGELEWNEMMPARWDEPDLIVEGSVKEKIRLASGYRGNSKVSPAKFKEAAEPKHVAISLTGEPTLYPYLSDLIKGFHQRGLTTFLVSNGTLPEALSRLAEEPTQLYISACAFDRKTFSETCRPQIPAAWEKLKQTLNLLKSFSCRTVIRITLVKGLNMRHTRDYGRLIEKASPDFVEPKAYMHVGFSRSRLGYQNMPSHPQVQDFALKLADSLGYNILDECQPSRVVLLSRFKEKRLIKTT
ncbi:MAG: 4-demethylwyosine synthase TYW1 [Candidatus Bathyarchaeia archaeon]